MAQLRPNRGVQTVIASALVPFQLARTIRPKGWRRWPPSAARPRNPPAPLRELVATETDPEVLELAEVCCRAS